MQRCNGFLISASPLRQERHCVLAGSVLSALFWRIVTGSCGGHFLDSLFLLIYLVLTRPHNQRFVERYILLSVYAFYRGALC